MSTDDRTPDRPASEADRLRALEAEVAAMRRELTELGRRLGESRLAPAPSSATHARERVADEEPLAITADMLAEEPLPRPSRQGLAPSGARPAEQARRPQPRPKSEVGVDLESLVGRYGTLAAGALVLLLGIGTLVVWAVQRGLLTPEIRVALGALATLCVAATGLYFRRRGDTRYGNVLLALSLAMTDVVAWGAGPRLHLVPTGFALAVVDVVSLGITALAVADESEFLLSMGVAGALAAPFVTSDQPGQAALLLAYGAVAQLGAMRAGRATGGFGHLVVLGMGAAVYVLAASSLPVGPHWFDAYLIPLYGGTLALGALLLPDHAVRGTMARVYLGIALLGVAVGWDAVAARPTAVSLAVAAGLAAVTYAALWVDEPEQHVWRASALLLPGLSLGVALAAASTREAFSVTLAGWGLLALVMWRAELRRGYASRGGTHLFLAIILVAIAVGNQLTLEPMWLVVGLAVWGVAAALLARHEASALPLLGATSVLLAAASAALILFTERLPYTQLPFVTRESACALVAVVALAVSGALLRRGRGFAGEHVTRGIAASVPAVVALWWGRMELVEAVSPDASTFLLTLYYAMVGVGAIVAGRRWSIPALRIGGLAIALYAGAKAVAQATGIETIGLRVGCYVLVGVFLLAAGWMYREARVSIEA